PACGKCNQSKGNKPWRAWMQSKAKWSPAGRNVADIAERIARLDAYERWTPPTKVDFDAIVGRGAWEPYWSLCDAVNDEISRSQQVADALRQQIVQSIKTAAAETNA